MTSNLLQLNLAKLPLERKVMLRKALVAKANEKGLVQDISTLAERDEKILSELGAQNLKYGKGLVKLANISKQSREEFRIELEKVSKTLENISNELSRVEGSSNQLIRELRDSLTELSVKTKKIDVLVETKELIPLFDDLKAIKDSIRVLFEFDNSFTSTVDSVVAQLDYILLKFGNYALREDIPTPIEVQAGENIDIKKTELSSKIVYTISSKSHSKVSFVNGGGSTTFISLNDTPVTYAGNAGKVVVVNATETGLDFTLATDIDEKVKGSATDPTAGYLDSKVDETTIEVSNNMLRVVPDVFAPIIHTHTASEITNFAEAVDDRVAALLLPGAGIDLSYNDGANTLTITSTITQYTDEMAQDAIGASLSDTTTINFTYTDLSGVITADVIPAGIDINDLSGILDVSNGGTGTATEFTSGSVVFAGTNGIYTQDNSNLFWDNANDALGIGTNSPGATLDVIATSGNYRALQAFNTKLTPGEDVYGIFVSSQLDDGGNYTNVQYAGFFIAQGGGSQLASYGVYGISNSTDTDGNDSIGVYGSGYTAGVRGEDAAGSSIGVYGNSSGGNGVQGSSSTGTGGYFYALSASGTGLYTQNTSATGYAFQSTTGLNYFDGNVGIGIATPLSRFHLKGRAVAAGTGTISSSGTTVTGVGTDFTQFLVGGEITASGQVKTISSITNGTSLTSGTFSPVLTAGTSFTYRSPIALWGSSTNSVVGGITAVGSMFIGTVAPGTSAIGDLFTRGTMSIGSASGDPGASAVLDIIDSRQMPTGSSTWRGLRVITNLTPTGAGHSVTGMEFTARDNAGHAFNLGTIQAISTTASFQDTDNNLTNMYGIFVNTNTAAGSTGTLSNAAGIRTNAFLGGPTTTYYGVYLAAPQGSGAVTNQYGIWVDNVSRATSKANAYAIYTNAGNVFLNTTGDADSNFRYSGDTETNLIYGAASTDRIGFGTASPSARVHVLYQSSITGNQNAVLLRGLKTVSGTDTFNAVEIDIDSTATDAGTQTAMNGLYVNANLSGSSSTISTLNNITLSGTVGTGKTVGTYRMLDIVNPTVSGTVSNLYGFYSAALTSGASNYVIYTQGEGHVVINENGTNAANVRVEGDTDPNLLFTHSANDTVQVGAATASDSAKFYVAGKISTNSELEVNGAFNHDGTTLGLYGVAPVTQQSITGSRGGNAALADLLTKLALTGIIVDTTTA